MEQEGRADRSGDAEIASRLATLRSRLVGAWLIVEKAGADFGLWEIAYAACLAAYIVCFTTVFLTDSIKLPPFLYVWGVLPFGALFGLKIVRTVPPISVIFWAGVVYLLMIGAGSFTDPSINKHMVKSYIRMSVLVMSFLLVTGILVVDQPARFLRTFFLVMSPVVALSALVNMIKFAYATPFSSFDQYRLVALFGTPGWRNATQIAPTYTIFFIGALGCLAAFRTSRLQQTVLISAMLVLLIAIIWTQARGAWAALLTGLLLFAGAASRAVKFVVIACAVLIGIAFVTIPALWTLIVERGSSFRLALWSFYLQKAIQHPWLGYGVFERIPFLETGRMLTDQPHNLVLWGQICGGVAAAAAVIVMLVLSNYWAYRYWLEQNNIAPLLLTTTMAVFGMVEVGLFSSEPDATWMTFWLPIAVCVGVEVRVRRARIATYAEGKKIK